MTVHSSSNWNFKSMQRKVRFTYRPLLASIRRVSCINRSRNFHIALTTSLSGLLANQWLGRWAFWFSVKLEWSSLADRLRLQSLIMPDFEFKPSMYLKGKTMKKLGSVIPWWNEKQHLLQPDCCNTQHLDFDLHGSLTAIYILCMESRCELWWLTIVQGHYGP